MSCVWLEEAEPRRDDVPATVDYLREHAPYSQYNGYSLRRDLCSFDSTLQQGNRMTICSCRTQLPERPQNLDRPHVKLRSRKARCMTASVLRIRHTALCQVLTFKRSIRRNDICNVAQIHPYHASLSWAVLRADDSLFRDHGWSADVRAARDSSWQFLRSSQHPHASFPTAQKGDALPSSAKACSAQLDKV